MKKIKMMPDVVVPEGGRMNVNTGDREDLPMTMVKFLNLCMNTHDKFGKGLEGVSQGLKIKNAYEKAKGHLLLEDPDYSEFKKAINGASLQPVLAMACKIYYDAIEEAVDVEVTKTTTAGKKDK